MEKKKSYLDNNELNLGKATPHFRRQLDHLCSERIKSCAFVHVDLCCYNKANLNTHANATIHMYNKIKNATYVITFKIQSIRLYRSNIICSGIMYEFHYMHMPMCMRVLYMDIYVYVYVETIPKLCCMSFEVNFQFNSAF